jgi:lipopolysaccharide biosynthesis glycosyltransferase
MNFVFALDSNIVQHLAVTLLSLFEAHSNTDIEVFFMLIDVPDSDVRQIDTLCRQFSRVKAHFKPFSIADTHRFPISGHVSIATYARVFLTDVLPAEWSRVIYLDCDLIVRRSFAAIWDCNMENVAIAGVPEPGKSRHAELGIPEGTPYLNAGVLLINLTYWREHDVKGQLLSYIWTYPEKLKFHDQDALNACLNKNVLQLPYCWNVTHIFYLGPYQSLGGIMGSQLLKLQRDPAVVHFTGPTKPWMYIMTHPFQEEYWTLLKRTPFGHAQRDPRTLRTFVFRNLRWVYRTSKRFSFLAYSFLAEWSSGRRTQLDQG